MRSYEQVKAIFAENGCRLLETEYVNYSTKMRYIAQCGHEHEITMSNFLRGKGRVCKECRYKKISATNTHSYEYVKNFFEKEGCTLLSKEYHDSMEQRLEYIATCGHKNTVTFNKFANGVGRVCLKCSKSKKYIYDEVFSEFEKKGCTLLECSYVNCKTPMRYIATCGHESEISFDVFMNAKGASLRCPKCQQIKHYSFDEVKAYFETNGCELLSSTYVTAKDKLEYRASCGHKAKIAFEKFLTGQGRKCNKCCKPTGEEHWKYNPDLTDEDREKRDMANGKIRAQRKLAFERDKYTCQVCGDNRGGNLEAHHLDSWDINKEGRFELLNLITLCESCHKRFHNEYGYGHNTKEQFKEFASGYANTEGLKINQVRNE